MTPPETNCSWPLASPNPVHSTTHSNSISVLTLPWRPLRGFLNFYFMLGLPLFISAEFLGSKAASEARLNTSLTDRDPGPPKPGGSIYFLAHTPFSLLLLQPDSWHFIMLIFGSDMDCGSWTATLACMGGSTHHQSSRKLMTLDTVLNFQRSSFLFSCSIPTTPLTAACWSWKARNYGLGA